MYTLEDLPITLTVEDLVPILNISKNTAYELVRSGRLKSVKIFRQYRIPRDSLIQFLQAEETG